MPAISTQPSLGPVEAGEDVQSVDLPEPDGPMIAVKVPRSKATSTPRSASTADVPAPKRFDERVAPDDGRDRSLRRRPAGAG